MKLLSAVKLNLNAFITYIIPQIFHSVQQDFQHCSLVTSQQKHTHNCLSQPKSYFSTDQNCCHDNCEGISIIQTCLQKPYLSAREPSITSVQNVTKKTCIEKNKHNASYPYRQILHVVLMLKHIKAAEQLKSIAYPTKYTISVQCVIASCKQTIHKYCFSVHFISTMVHSSTVIILFADISKSRAT